MENKYSTVSKIIFSIALIFINIQLIIIGLTPPASTYEIWLFDAYPSYFIGIFILIEVCGITLVLFFNDQEKNPAILTYVLIIFLINSAIYLSLPLFRGYFFFGRSDSLLHIGAIVDLLKFGHFGMDNIYPAPSIACAEFLLISNTNIGEISILFPLIFSIGFIFSIFVLSKVLENNNLTFSLIILALSSLLLFGETHTRFWNTDLFFLYMPLVLFLYYKSISSNGISFKILLTISLVLMIFFHPIDSQYLLLMFVCMGMSIFIFNLLSPQKIKAKQQFDFLFPTTILFCVFCIWFFSLTFIFGNIKKVISYFTEFDFEGSAVGYVASTSQNYNIPFSEILTTFFKVYGGYFIFCFVSVIIILIVIKNFQLNKKINLHVLTFSLIFIVFGLLTALSIIISPIGFGRIIRYMGFPSIILCSYGLFSFFEYCNLKLMSKKIFKYSAICLVIILLIIVYSISLVNVIPSPITRSKNVQVTEMEYNNIIWLNKYSNSDFFITSVNFEAYRLSFAAFGRIMALEIPNTLGWWNTNFRPPLHFGYDTNFYLNQQYSHNTYLVISKMAHIIYQRVYPDFIQSWAYNPQDYERLENDQTVSKIFSSHDVEVYFIQKGG